MDKTRRCLHSGWEFAFADHAAVDEPAHAEGLEYRAAQVPGTNLTDLQAAGLVARETAADYEKSFSLYRYMDFVYRTEFDGGEEAGREHALLRFDGLDTICDVFLNGERLGRTENAYMRFRFDVTTKLEPGRNTLVLILQSPILGAATRRATSNLRFPASFGRDFMYIRKPAYSYFWDWGPEVPVSGIYRPVFLEAFDRGEIEDFHIRYQVEGERVTGSVQVWANAPDGAQVTLELAGHEESIAVVDGTASASFVIDPARLWYPHGEGEPSLYDLGIALHDGEPIDRVEHRVGFRAVEVLRDERADGPGRRFRLRVNGREIFCRGYNWIPVDSSIPRGYYDRYRANLDLAQRGNANMIRVWGGGYYEDDEFYRMCDERGLMVWQDGMFACSMYPDTEPGFLKLVEAELTQNIKRLRNYTSLVLWCGENEGHWGWEEWWTDLREQFPRFYGEQIFDTMFALLVTQLDPDRFYWNGSPYSGEPGIPANHPRYGDVHFWSLHTNCEDFARFRQIDPSFVSETGIQSLPDLRTALSIGTPADHRAQSFVMDTRNHYMSPAKNERLLKFTGALFQVSTDFRDAVVLSNLAHAEYLRYATEYWRSQAYDCGGILFWQLNDCWPAVSWAAVDYGLSPKACWYAMRRAFAPEIVGWVQRFDNDYTPEVTGRGDLFVASERDGYKEGAVTMRALRVTGEEVAAHVFPVVLDGRGVVRLGEVPLPDYETNRFDALVEFTLQWDGRDAARNVYTYSRPKHMHLPRPRLEVTQASAESVRVSTDTFAKGAYLFHPDPGVVFDDNYVDLMPGESREIGASRQVSAGDVSVLVYHNEG